MTVITTTDVTTGLSMAYIDYEDGGFDSSNLTFKAMYAEYCVSLSEAVTFRNVLVFVPKVSCIRQNVSGTTTVFINGGSVEVSQDFSAVVNLFQLFTMP